MTSENKTAAKEIRVLLAHRYALVRESLAGLLNGAGFEIVANVEREEDLVRLAARYSPDILLLAWDLPKAPVNLIGRLTSEESFPGTLVLVGPPPSSEAVMGSILAGARGYLSLNLPASEFISRLRFLAQGDFLVSQDIAFSLGGQIGTAKAAESSDGLSDRERQVLELVATGATNKEIANELAVSENTVKAHLRHILDKLDLRNRQQAAAYAVREGMTALEYDQELWDQTNRTGVV